MAEKDKKKDSITFNEEDTEVYKDGAKILKLIDKPKNRTKEFGQNPQDISPRFKMMKNGNMKIRAK